LNLYRMVRNNPVTWHDPNGLITNRHPESEGESEDEDDQIVYRALRPNERPELDGLRPPPGDSSVSAADHIRAGSRAKIKSAWVSATRSIRTAAAWAAQDGFGRVAVIKIPEDMPREYVHDLTTDKGLQDVFKSTEGMAVNFAKSSKEVVLKGGVRQSDILAVYDVERISEDEYGGRERVESDDMDFSIKYSKSRSKKSEKIDGKKVKTTPYPVRLKQTYNCTGINSLKRMPGKRNWNREDYLNDYAGRAEFFYKTFKKNDRKDIKRLIGKPSKLDDVNSYEGLLSYKYQVKNMFASRRTHGSIN
ncbi:hypothetical protein LQR30_23095, partial [Chromobacterium piscinae]|uniref:hypothetical protein n=1 Tax=Chromobacterium piscinae TaxID=686831 RepID=UPI001E46A265